MTPPQSLCAQLLRFNAWATDVPRDFDGWESTYPQWNALLATATAQMVRFNDLSDVERRCLDEMWTHALETEELVDFAEANAEHTLPYLQHAAGLPSAEARALAAKAAGAAGRAAVACLTALLADRDEMVRRYALLALGRVDRESGRHAAERLKHDSAESVRHVARNMLL